MNGADALIAGLVDAGVDTCFANPGTTELELVAALDRSDAVRSVLCLAEGICSGAADGYARVARKPAMTLLHLGPGFANSLANLHNAKRAASPVVTVIGDHATWHLAADAPLTSDIESLAAPMSVSVTRLSDASTAFVEARQAALFSWQADIAGPATIIVPQDVCWTDAPDSPASEPDVLPEPHSIDDPDHLGAPHRLGEVLAALRASQFPVLLLGGAFVDPVAQRWASAIAQRFGGRALVAGLTPRHDRGGSLPSLDLVGYFPEQARSAFAGADLVVLCGTRAPVTFFGYPNDVSTVIDTAVPMVQLCSTSVHLAPWLERLGGLAGVDLPDSTMVTNPAGNTTKTAPGPITASSLGGVLAVVVPDNAIVVNEALSNAGCMTSLARGAQHIELSATTGGAIGNGLPCALGAAIAAPERRVIAVQADGSAAYSLQALWSMAREQCNVTVILLSNRRYAILDAELKRAASELRSKKLTDLAQPAIDWVSLAQGFGVPGISVSDTDSLTAALRHALATPGPYLIEAVMP
jgi:acetolactate synthase I/II/III large subunit